MQGHSEAKREEIYKRQQQSRLRSKKRVAASAVITRAAEEALIAQHIGKKGVTRGDAVVSDDPPLVWNLPLRVMG